MKEHPILFSATMVRAILAGKKTQTRRLVKPLAAAPLPTSEGWNHEESALARYEPTGGYTFVPLPPCPYGAPGDRLWVRETWAAVDYHTDAIEREDPVCIGYKADLSARRHEGVHDDIEPEAIDTYLWNWDSERIRWRPSIHMPRWASRITLEVTGVRVERLQDISEEDARAEGVERDAEPCDHTRISCEEIKCLGPTYRSTFCELWDAINGKRAPWASNPWVWIIEFRRVEAARERAA